MNKAFNYLKIKLLIIFWMGVAYGISVVFCQELSETVMRNELVQLFREKVRDGALPQLLEAHGTFNIAAETLGGKFFWTTYAEGGWKLQFNDLSDFWRILDADDVRRARGTTYSQLRNLLEDRPTSVVPNYFDDGYRFGKVSAAHPTGRTVVLIHGWGVRASSMQELANALAAEGYDAYNYDYPSAEAPLATLTTRFVAKFRELLSRLSADESLYFLTHSMGGLVLRGALAQLTVAEARRIQAIVMLGPPNQGSLLAYFGKLPFVGEVNLSLEDMTPDAGSYTMNIPAPVWLPPVGIIAGSMDGKVSVESTHLPGTLEHKHVVITSSHPGLRNPEKVFRHILKFFNDKEF